MSIKFELPDFFKSTALNLLKEKMGLDKSANIQLGFSVNALSAREIKEKLNSKEGLEIDIKDLVFEDDGTLSIQGKKVLLYIRDIIVHGNNPKFHITKCRTLNSKFETGEKNRYVVSTRTDGIFLLNINGQPKDEELKVCINCLSKLNWDNYKEKRKAIWNDDPVKNFSIDAFFKKNPSSLHAELPDYTDKTAPKNYYTDDWDAISKQLRTQKNWRCESCRIDCSSHNMQKYLQTHHINRQKNDNSPNNLKVLCIQCHAEQPNHHHIKNSPDYNEFLSMVK